MHTRVSHYKVKPGKLDEAIAARDEMLPTIEKLPGLVRYLNLWNDDGTGAVVAVYESPAAAEAAAATAKDMWSSLADILEPEVTIQEFANGLEVTP